MYRVARALWPPRPLRGRLHSQNLPGALSIRAPAGRRELRGEHEQRRTVRAAERSFWVAVVPAWLLLDEAKSMPRDAAIGSAPSHSDT